MQAHSRVACSGSNGDCEYYREPGRLLSRSGCLVTGNRLPCRVGYCVTKKSVTKSVTTQYRFPYQIVVGDKEKQENKVAVRRKAEDLGSLNGMIFYCTIAARNH